MASTPVQKELRKIAADYRRYQILRGLAASWAAVAGLGLFCLLIYWAGGIFIPYSAAILLGVAFVAAAYVFWRNERTDVALREIARLIEKDDPTLNTLLLAAAEQQPDPKTGELNFLQTRVIQEAIEANRRAPWNVRFSKRLAWVQTAHLLLLCGLAAVVLACAMTAPRGSAAQTSAKLGFGVEITPGNTTVEKGSTVAILAKFHGSAPSSVNLVYQAANGEEKKLAMARSLSDPLFGLTLPELQEKTFYRIEYEGRQSEQFTADVFEFPDLKRADAELKFPEYTGFSASKIEDTRRITAVEGTDVRYTFFLNKAVKSARLLGTNDTQIVLTNNGANAVQYAADFRLLESGHFKLELVDEAGRTNKIPPDFVFAALENQRPKMKLKAPRGDGRVSALEEVAFNAQAEDDFGLSGYGLAYRMAGQETKLLSLSQETPTTKGLISKPHESRDFGWMLAMEKIKAEPGQLVSYYLWADDLGPDGKPRRTESDMYFAEVRPFEEISREGDSGGSQQQQQQQQQQNPATKLLELEKQIITATWNLQRREIGAKPTPAFKKDSEVVRDSQQQAWQQAEELKEKLNDEKSHAIIENVITAMDNAIKNLKTATAQNAPKSLPPALEFEQSAYQGLLRLQAREYQVSRSKSQSGQQQSSRGERAQRQLDQLELKEEQNRYETESQATPLQNPEQRESLQVLNRLKELARRQQDMSERLKELQSALNEAKTKEEKEKLERMLKRLQEEQQQIVQDTDELKQRMAQPENQSRMADAQKQLDKSREQSRDAAQQLQEGNVGQALSSSARAQKQLQDLSNDFRKSTSSQFSEQMRNLRQEARELTEKQEQLQQKLQEVPETRQRTLSDQGPQKEIKEGLAQQRSAFTNILENIRQVTEQAEAAEPLLARQLYETWRKANQTDLDKNMQIASQALDRNIMPIAREALKRTDPPVKDLREGVEQAARGVLGDEAESLRFAEKELQELTDRVQKELDRARGIGSGSTNGGTNMMAAARGQGGTNSTAAFAQSGSTNRAGARQAGGENGQEQRGDGERQLALNDAQGQQQGEQGQDGQPGQQGQQGQGQRGQRGQRGQQNNGQQNGDQQQASNEQQQGQGEQSGEQNGEQPGGQQGATQASAQGQQQGQQGQEGQQGQQGQQGQRGQRGQRGQGGRGGQVAQQGQQRGQPQGGQPQDGQQQQQAGARFFEQWANGGRAGGGAVTDGSNGGPLTGADYTAWSDRLRNLEEVLQNPQLRNQAAEILDRARGIRMDYTKRGVEPRWDLVNTNLLKPMRILQTRVAEELARLGPRDTVVPVDRDPVPQKYTDLVSRYYERLGKD